MPTGYSKSDSYTRDHRDPYTRNHPIPTIQKYREEKEARRAAAVDDSSGATAPEQSRLQAKTDEYREGLRNYWNGEPWYGKEDKQDSKQNGQADTAGDRNSRSDNSESDDEDDDRIDLEKKESRDDVDQSQPVDTSEVDPSVANPHTQRKRRSQRKHGDERAEREVTDPITHLPVKIHDLTADLLEAVEENPPAYGVIAKTATGLSNQNKSKKDLREELSEMQKDRESMNALFPPPDFEEIQNAIVRANNLGFTVAVTGTLLILLALLGLERGLHTGLIYSDLPKDLGNFSWLFGVGTWVFFLLAGIGGAFYFVSTVRAWTANQISEAWVEQVWEANRKSCEQTAKTHKTETVAWFNSLIGSVWPLVNPDLMISLADTLEDVMQASLPSIVSMVSIDDIGQGSEAVRILGVKWLPTAAAARTVTEAGKMEKKTEKKSKQEKGDTKMPQDQPEPDSPDKSSVQHGDPTRDPGQDDENEVNDDGTEKQITNGLEGEDGDFINLEIAFAYRARTPSSAKQRNKDLHLLLAFYLMGNIKIPIWVDVKGLVGTIRLRLQLIPDPPFFGTCLLTFLGQPRVELSCIPLLKHGLNIMDLPLIKNFVQGSVDAAMSQYVAPKSLLLDLQDMLSGDDFKKDTNAIGVLAVQITRGYDFKMGDVAIPLLTSGGSDPYVSVGWAKFGKAMWSTRVLIKEMEPVWRETAYLLVNPEAVNVHERLRVQLWDSDKFTADDDLGRIEIDLKELMEGRETKGRMAKRKDGFRSLKAGEEMPGKLEWQVGYFPKLDLQDCQFKQQTFDPEIRSKEALQQKVDQICKEKLREVRIKKGRHESEIEEGSQQHAREMKTHQDAMMMSSPPPENYPSGILSIQIHQITALGYHKLSHNEDGKDEHAPEETEEGGDLPSAYCNIILNHRKIYKTRVKPSNAKPFFNASTEKWVPDWRTAEAYVVVRDACVDEDDPVIGIIHLPLGEIFEERTQVAGWYPLVGGIGFGRIRLSLVWRSVGLQSPPEALGWDVGTLEVQPNVTAAEVPSELRGLTLRFRTQIGKGKMHPNSENEQWSTHSNRSLHLPVYRRYSRCLAIEFKRVSKLGGDKVIAFALLWLRDIPDDEEQEVTLPVWKGDYERARATALEECGEKQGQITVKVKFLSGMGGAHRKWAKSDPNLRNVMEVLEIARDNYETAETERAAGIVQPSSGRKLDQKQDEKEDGDLKPVATAADANADASSSDDSDSDSDDDEQDDDKKIKKSDSHMGIIDQARDYKKHARQEHRQNRGVMQYKIPRTAQWTLGKAERLEQKISGVFRRHTREPGIETEA